MSRPTLDDLDRCEHGRHSIDNCHSCPGGLSTGNWFVLHGQRIGTDLYGEPIFAMTHRNLDGYPIEIEESNFVKHARRELELVGEEPRYIEWYLNVIRAYAAFGHSGGTLGATLSTLYALLQFQNLTPLTDNPNEWIDVAGYTGANPGGVWQNIRNSEAFSYDNRQTYYLNSEGGKLKGPAHKTKKHDEPVSTTACEGCGQEGCAVDHSVTERPK